MRRPALSRSCFFLSLFLIAVGARQQAIAAPPSDEQIITKVDALIADRLAEPEKAGFSVVIAIDNRPILTKGYGQANIKTALPVDTNTVFGIGSVTKQFTAAAIMRLSEQGKLSLDDDINKFLPDFPTQGHIVTIRHLLTHTSGIKSYTAVDEFWSKGAFVELSTEEVLAYIKDRDFDFVPGKQFKYSNTGYYILGAIIEQASAVTYPQYLQEEFFIPLNMNNSRCDSITENKENLAQGYTLKDNKLQEDAQQAIVNYGGAGMIISNASDLVKWNTALFGGKVVSKESLEQMILPTILPGGASTGYGFGLNLGDLNAHRAIMHSGGMPGYSALLAYFPDDNLYIAVNSNVFSDSKPASSVARDIARVIFDIEESVVDLKPSKESIAQFIGLYLLDGENREIKIVERDGYLYMQPSGKLSTKLLYQGQGEFRPKRNTAAKITFDPEVDQNFVLQQNGHKSVAIRIALADKSPTTEEIERFSGTYIIQQANFEVKIIEQDGFFFLHPKGRSPARLLYQGSAQFRAKDDPTTMIVFDLENGKSFTLHQNGNQAKGIRQPDD
jgi:D-alanyl-D-alanine carboxypeptidase